jgi:hypothetical protein
MDYKSYKKYGNVIVAQRSDYLWGVLDHEGNEIVPFGKYGWIDGFDQGLARVRTQGNSGRVTNTIAIIDLESDKAKVVEGRGNLEDFIRLDRAKHPEIYAKWGIINEQGEEVLPVEYDDVWNFLGKNRFSTKVVMNGTSHEVLFHDLNPYLPLRGQRSSSRSYDGDYDYNDNWGNDDGIDYEEETWYALTDGQYGDYPGPGVDYDFLGF